MTRRSSDRVSRRSVRFRRLPALPRARTFPTRLNTHGLFISKDDLIASKLAAGRLRDLADVEDIREATESQGPQDAKKKRPETNPSGPGQ